MSQLNSDYSKFVCGYNLSKQLKDLGIHKPSLFKYSQKKKSDLIKTTEENNLCENIAAYLPCELKDMLPCTIQVEDVPKENGEIIPSVHLYLIVKSHHTHGYDVNYYNENAMLLKNSINSIKEADALAILLIWLIENKIIQVKK